MENDPLYSLVTSCKTAFAGMIRHLEAGMTPSVAFEMAWRDIDLAYKIICTRIPVQPKEHLLQPSSIELEARFALDCLFGAQAGGCNETDQRKAFWLSFHKATRTATAPADAAATTGE